MRRARWAVAVAALAVAGAAAAHPVGLSRGEYRLQGGTLRAALEFAPGELPPAGAAELLRDGVVASAGGARCTGDWQVSRMDDGGARAEALLSCPAAAADRAVVELPLLDRLSPGHRHIAKAAAGGQEAESVLFRGQARLEVSATAAPRPSFLSFVGLGFEHILSGIDHLLFLFGLLLVGGRFRELAKVVTAFTVAHSLTLAATVLGLLAPSPRLTEPLIALSIAYVGVENLFRPDPKKRWRLTFLFGLVHGFGFAGALAEISLPAAQKPLALLGFNAGVELGQLAVLALVLPALNALSRAPWFARRAVPALSALIVVPAMIWFVARVAV
ncbi:MAG TPA: HupE/UreJ family protein [Myxococcales bacterium]|nr:HupE/UreJ family protein [Myxococcales bacterium]